jgi:photosystem II stability/assembly factor-like uncharacterized protein
MVYANSDTYGLYAGGGSPFTWRRVAAVAPDVEVAVGRHREVLYGLAWGLYRSDDGGKDWRRISCNYGAFNGGIAVSKSDPSSLYQVGQAGDDALDHVTGGYYRSTNEGKTWSRSAVGATQYDGPVLQAVAVSPTNPNDVTVASYYGGVFRTGNGDDWAFTGVPKSSHQVETLGYGAGTNPVLWAGTSAGAFRRLPDGTWVPAGLSGRSISVFPDADVAAAAFAVVEAQDNPGHACVRRTTNSGSVWLRVEALPCHIIGVSVSARDDAVYAWTTRTLYRSNDRGTTWTRLPPLPVG